MNKTMNYKISAVVGIILMGIGAFMASLSENPTTINLGNILLIASLIILTFTFSKWQP